MDITVSSPGSPGTSFTDNVKGQILLIYDILEKSGDFASVHDLGIELEKYDIKWSYARNILAFLQNCGIVNYQNVEQMKNDRFFTNIGNAYVDILKVIRVFNAESESSMRNEILELLENIQEEIYFQCLVIMMKNPNCNYGYDFFDVLRFVKKYESIDSTEYFLLQYERKTHPDNYLEKIGETVEQYRDGSINITIKTIINKNEEGAAKSVNSFPYVNGNFTKCGVFYKGDDARYYIVKSRMPEINNAIQEVSLCLNSAKKQ